MYTSLPLTELSLKEFQDKTESVLFTSKSAARVGSTFISGLTISDTHYVTTADRKLVDSQLRKLTPAKKIYAVGGGRVCDVARYAAKIWNAELTIIPTIISSDAFLVDCSGLRENGCVTYIPTKSADQVIIDWELLLKSPVSLHTAGCGDVLSIVTALHDWRLANQHKKNSTDEIFDSSIALMAQGIVDALIESAQFYSSDKKQAIKILITCLAAEITLCNFYGNSRPEEGGEHYFAYCIETKIPHLLHGEILGLGILCTAFLQKQDWRKLKLIMESIGLSYLPDAANSKVIIETLQELPSYVKKHNLRYSIYNTFIYDEQADDIKQFLRSIGVK